jgi:DNA polymerase sigma
VILDYTSFIFIQIAINIGDFDKKEIMNKLAKLYHKLKNLYFFNILIFLYKKIEKILQSIYDSYDKHFVNFEIKNDFILSSIYDYEQNINNEYKSLSINIKSTNSQKYKFLCNILEEIEIKEDIYRNYILLRGDLEEGCTLKVKFNDDYLLLNNNNLNKLKELLKNYGIENTDWDRDRRKPINLLSNEEKKQKDELKNKKEEENKEKLSNALIMQENFVKNNFKNTKKNTKLFKTIFSKLEEIILSDEKIKNKIIKILPYGSVTQCTCNENSDLEMTILTKNYEKCNEKFIFDLFEKILDNISKNTSSEFDPYLEGIRTTKRTILLLLIHKESKTKIEINCNNFFSVMNSTLIRNYLTYDARALILINTIKDWSKQKEINSNSKLFLSSYCYTLMTIFFLQRMKNPLLPIISSRDNLIRMKISEKEFFLEKELLNTSESMKNWHTQNKDDTVVTLMLKWMIFYLYIFNNEEYCIDISNKKLCFRVDEATYLNEFIKGSKKKSAYCMIDMFDYTYNPGSYMEMDSEEHRIFKTEMESAIKMILEGKVDFFLAK